MTTERDEARFQVVDFRLERIEQALHIFAAEAASNPHLAAAHLKHVLSLTQNEFVDRNLSLPGT